MHHQSEPGCYHEHIWRNPHLRCVQLWIPGTILDIPASRLCSSCLSTSRSLSTNSYTQGTVALPLRPRDPTHKGQNWSFGGAQTEVYLDVTRKVRSLFLDSCRNLPMFVYLAPTERRVLNCYSSASSHVHKGARTLGDA